jgi:hypothetical protein
MKDELLQKYSKQQLEHIIEEAMIYMCACPAQVAEQLVRLRELFAYQMKCSSDSDLMKDVHTRIADSTRKAHAEMEQCLSEVLHMEGWDPHTLSMPAGLRQLREKIIDQD